MSAGSGAAFETDLLSMILQSGPVVQAVLLLLIILSVMSWSVTIAKFLYFSTGQSGFAGISQYFLGNERFFTSLGQCAPPRCQSID